MTFCQSCGMPLADPGLFGTNADGTPNTEYCLYCYKDGDFTADLTMDEMIAKGIATKEGERADGKNINIIVNGDVERIDGHVNLLGVKGNVRRINTSHGDIAVNGDVDGDVHTNYGDISCGNIDGDARTNFGNIYRK